MKRILLYIVILFSALQLNAQESNGEKKTTVEAAVVAYVTKNLNLTVDEANAFMPVFKNYMKEHRAATVDKENDEIKKNEAIIVVQRKFKPQFQAILNSEKRANSAFRVHQQLVQRLKTVADRRKKRPAGGRSNV